MKNPFGRPCIRFVKYDGHKVVIPGVSFGNLQISKSGITPSVLRNITTELILLDFSQYDLCMSIKNMSNTVERERYEKIMVDDKLRASRIYQRLVALSISPKKLQTQENLEQILEEYTPRAKEIQASDILSKALQTNPIDNVTIENSLNIKVNSITEDFKQYYHRKIIELFEIEIKILQIGHISTFLVEIISRDEDIENGEGNATIAICLCLDILQANMRDWYDDIIHIFSLEDVNTEQAIEKLQDLKYFIQKRERSNATKDLLNVKINIP